MRWYRFLMRLFPPTHQASQSGEMLDALSEAPSSLRRTLSESRSILWASVHAWLRHTRTRQAVRGGLFFGACLWLGLAIGLGPILRSLTAVAQRDLHGLESANLLLPAAIVLGAAIAALVWNRWAPGVLAVVGIVLAGLSNRVGEFQAAASLMYEFRHLGIAFVLVLAARPSGVRFAGPLGVAAAASVPVVASVAMSPRVGRNYGLSLYELRRAFDEVRYERAYTVPPADDPGAIPEVVIGYSQRHYFGLQIMDFVVLFVILFLALTPWLTPAVAAMALPITAAWTFDQPLSPAVLVFAYLAAAIYMRTSDRQLSFWGSDTENDSYGRGFLARRTMR